VTRAAILDPRGRLLGPETDLEAIYPGMGAPTVALHRGRLHDVLIEAVGLDRVVTGVAVTGFEQHPDHVTVLCADGRRIETELLVGADGLRSAVRTQLAGASEPVYSGYTSWRGMTPAGAVPPPSRMGESWGHGERFGIVEVGDGELYWFAVANAPPQGRDIDAKAELLRRFGGWHAPIRDVLEATPVERILRTDISDREPITRWHEGRAVLLGDAAHPMTPNLGQGAGQAIEDAVALDASLAEHDDVEAALSAYEQARVARANAIVLGSRRFGRVAQWSHPAAVAIRNLAVALTPNAVKMAQARRLTAEV
jgi:2-polyprenyl-6-methoxyphenol hydroxylase-like FAD-dependent oxidoreductase